MLRVVLFLPLLALIGNLVFLDYQYVSKGRELELEDKITSLEDKLSNFSPGVITATASATSNACPQSCVDTINSAIKSLPKSTTSTPATKVTVNSKAEYYVPLGTGTVSTIGDWATIDSAQANFNPDDYPANSAIYFEVVMHTSGSGEVQARLYDATTPNIFAGEVLKTQSATGELLSVQMKYLLHGSKTYKVQMNTSIASAVLDSARLRVVTQ